jgi:hypothetical protein
MGYALQVGTYLLWFPLMGLTINAVRRSGARRYPLIFAYLVLTFLICAVQAPAALAYQRSAPGRRLGEWLQTVQVVGELAAYSLLLMVVFSLIYQATARFGGRRLMRTILTAGPLLVIAISFLLEYDEKAIPAMWITAWSRDLKFCAAVLDLALWGLLLATRNPDVKLLLLTGGMGIMLAGNAIAESIRLIALRSGSNPLHMGSNVLSAISDLVFLYVWWRAFRDTGRLRRAGAS